MQILIIIPAYNEQENIERVVDNLVENYPQYDYLVINDCSKDQTEQILTRRGYRHLSLPVNLGIGGGVQTGYLYAVQHGYDVVIQFDGDGQHNAEYIADLVRPIAQGEADIVIGSRFLEKEGFQTSFLRRLGIRILKHTIRLCSGAVVNDATSGFRATNRAMTEFYAQNYAQDYPEPEAITAAALNGFRIKEIPVIMNERKAGVSSISPLKSVYYMIKVNLAILFYRVTGNRQKKKVKQ